MPRKGKQPRCKNCNHVFFKHKWDEIDKKEIRGECKAKGCNCKEYVPMDKNDHRHTW